MQLYFLHNPAKLCDTETVCKLYYCRHLASELRRRALLRHHRSLLLLHCSTVLPYHRFPSFKFPLLSRRILSLRSKFIALSLHKSLHLHFLGFLLVIRERRRSLLLRFLRLTPLQMANQTRPNLLRYRNLLLWTRFRIELYGLTLGIYVLENNVEINYDFALLGFLLFSKR